MKIKTKKTLKPRPVTKAAFVEESFVSDETPIPKAKKGKKSGGSVIDVPSKTPNLENVLAEIESKLAEEKPKKVKKIKNLVAMTPEVKSVELKPKKGKKKHVVAVTPGEDQTPVELKPKKGKKKNLVSVTPTESATKSKKKKVSSEKVASTHKASLNKLKSIDPEFYKFLELNDNKLLKFDAEKDLEEDDDDKEEEEIIDDVGEDGGGSDDEQTHKPSDGFDAASDESDFEPESDDEDEPTNKSGPRTITLKLLKKWQQELSEEKVQIDTIKNVIQAVCSALLSISGEKMIGALFKVEGAGVFNGVLQLCVLHLHPAIKRYLGLGGKTSKQAHKCKKWSKIRTYLKSYLLDLTKLLEHVSSTNILVVLLKHLHQISPMITSFSQLTKPILKRLVTLWSTSEETVRVLAFLCILKITRGQQTSLLNTILKAMYLSYIRNSKFVSPSSLPSINFMRRSLTEMFALDLNISYQHVFLYIRQLAIHLRNALTLKKKDSFQAVYNWQFVNSLRLWTELLSATSNKAQLQPLIFPLVSIITGVIKLIPTAQFFPLRFHCIQTLIQLSKETRSFIPVLPFILEVLNSNTFNKKHSKVSMKPLPFTCLLRLNKGQLLENGFRDEVIENVFGQTLEYMANESFTISYPDLVVPCVISLKQYLKRCKNSNYSRKLKQLVDKLEENGRLIEAEREKISFTLKDTQLIAAWEASMREKGTPLLVFFNSWTKTQFNLKKRQAVSSDDINDYNLPTIKRKAPGSEKKRSPSDGPVDLFPSDEEDEELELEKPLPKKQKYERKPRPVPVYNEDDDDYVDDGVDIVKDLDLDDW